MLSEFVVCTREGLAFFALVLLFCVEIREDLVAFEVEIFTLRDVRHILSYHHTFRSRRRDQLGKGPFVGIQIFYRNELLSALHHTG